MKNKKKELITSVFLLVLIFVLAITSYLFIRLQFNRNSAEISAFQFPLSNVDKTFLNVVGSNVNVNDGITAENMDLVHVPMTVGLSSNDIGYVVLNHTDEYILFQNQGFGLKIYTYDKGTWKNYELRSEPFSQKIRLSPNLDKLDIGAANFFVLPNKYVDSLGLENFRLYVTGVGEATGVIYGAFIDISIEP